MRPSAKKAKWVSSHSSVVERSRLLSEVAHMLKCKRGELIGVLVADAGKVAEEADVEVSEAIDFVEYYRRNMEELEAMEDIQWSPKGTILIAPPWNFSCSIPLGGIVAAIASGNCVIFKPALPTVLVGWHIANICWEAGISRDVLQFVPCVDDPVGSMMVKDPRISSVVLTGETATAKKMLSLRSGLNLIAETGGKNALIISNMADRDLAIHDLVQSAFAHAGQKCSACSLAICLPEIYDDPHFRETLRDAAASLKVGPAWNLSTRVNPLIKEPDDTLRQGLTTLEKGESWLLEPRQDIDNPNLWSPGIKLGVQEGSFTYQNELFGPVLGIMRADNLEHAIKLANGTLYGLTSGIHTLDEREQEQWISKIEAGNQYVNRGITGAIVRRQPFGGCKESSFGFGAKAGGPNYVMQMLDAEQVSLPKETEQGSGTLNVLTLHLEKMGCTPEEMESWKASIGSYMYHWKNTFSKDHDPSQVLGQDNILRYVPHSHMLFRVQTSDAPLDIMRVVAAAVTCQASLEISGNPEDLQKITEGEWAKITPHVKIKEEDETQLIERLERGGIKRVRLLTKPSTKLQKSLAEASCNVILVPVLANGRVELFNHLREVNLSINYHRYGNLGLREPQG